MLSVSTQPIRTRFKTSHTTEGMHRIYSYSYSSFSIILHAWGKINPINPSKTTLQIKSTNQCRVGF